MTRQEQLGMLLLWLDSAIEDGEDPDEFTLSEIARLGFTWTGDSREISRQIATVRKAERA